MSRRATERAALNQTVTGCAFRAFRLRERAAAAATPARARMLKAMSNAYMAFGLAKSHREHGAEVFLVVDIWDAGKEKLRAARKLLESGNASAT
jgi:hypothetical protein